MINQSKGRRGVRRWQGAGGNVIEGERSRIGDVEVEERKDEVELYRWEYKKRI